MANNMRYFIGNWKMFGVPNSINILKKINNFIKTDKNAQKYTEDSFICEFGGRKSKDSLSHIVIDMISMTNNWFRYDENGGTHFCHEQR